MARKKKKQSHHPTRKEKKTRTSPPLKSSPALQQTRRPTRFYLVCLISLSTVIYLNTLQNQFVFDDIPLVLDNHFVKHIEKFPSYFFSSIAKIPYRPLRMITYAIDYQFTGLNPVGYHVSSIVFHVLTTLVLYFTIFALTGKSRVAFFAACLFAVHPVHTDSVAYISGRRDILSTLFYLLGFYCFLKARQKDKSRLLILALAAYLFALASKEMAVTLPAICFLYDLLENLPEGESFFKRCSTALTQSISRYKLYYFSFLVPAILFTCYKVLLESPSNKVGYYGGSLYIQILTVGKILIYYIKLLFFPINLIADYSFNSFPLSTSFFEPTTFLSFCTLCFLAALSIKLLNKNKTMVFALLWFFITLLPVCHIIPHHELLAEHYLYLPSFGFFLLIALVLENTLTFSTWRRSILLVFVFVILLFATRTFYRNFDWKNSYTLWSKTVSTVPNCVRAINNLGIEYYKRKDYEQAKSMYQRALKIQPAYEKAYYNLGNVYRVEQDFASALAMYQKTAQLNPKNFLNHNNLGNAYAMQGLYEQAAKEYQLALKYKPRYAEAYNNLGNVYRSLGQPDRAIIHYQKAIQLNARYVDAYHNLASIHRELKQYDKAIQTLENLCRHNPFIPATINKLGVFYEQSAQYDRAVEMYKRALKLQPHFPEAQKNLNRVNGRRNAERGEGRRGE
jgi:tetratricopeptide (TPR) repeat protein